jgi:GT2 family glycosyltransferase
VSYTAAIPMRDGAATIAHVVRAAWGQSPRPARVFVCDDGSRDTGADSARRAGAEIVTHPRPLGLAAARNTLLNACVTDIIVFFDADAIPRPGCAAALLAGFQPRQTAAVGGRGVEAAYGTFADRWRAAHTPQSHGEAPLDDDWMVMGLCMAFRTEALRAVGGFDPRFRRCGEDVDVSLRLRAAGWRLAYRPDAVVDHARSDGAVSVLCQAWRHSRETARAFRTQDQSLAALRRDTWRALAPSLRQELRHLNGPAALLTATNLLIRQLGLLAGARE